MKVPQGVMRHESVMQAAVHKVMAMNRLDGYEMRPLELSGRVCHGLKHPALAGHGIGRLRKARL